MKAAAVTSDGFPLILYLPQDLLLSLDTVAVGVVMDCALGVCFTPPPILLFLFY